MWKFQDFSITQIIRETKFGDPGSSKNAIFGSFGNCESTFFGQLQPSKTAKIHKI